VLLQEAVAGDGFAFVALYDRYESRIFNFCLRLVDSPEDAADATQEAFLNVLRRLQNDEGPVLNFSAYLFAAARNECFRVSKRGGRTDLVDEALEGPHAGAEPPPIETDPERSALLEASQDEVRVANARLPLRYREVLALRELEGCSYEEIAQILGTNRNAVSQLIWRARTKLREELQAGAVHSVALTSEDCERAQALMSLAEDGELDGLDRAWLERHLKECANCRTRKAALVDVGASYRAWLPIAVLAGMRPHVLTRGGEIVGADWSTAAASGSGSASGGTGAGSGSASGGTAATPAGVSPYAAVGAVGAVAAATLALVLTLVLTHGSKPSRPAAKAAPTPAQKKASHGRHRAAQMARRHPAGPALRAARRSASIRRPTRTVATARPAGAPTSGTAASTSPAAQGQVQSPSPTPPAGGSPAAGSPGQAAPAPPAPAPPRRIPVSPPSPPPAAASTPPQPTTCTLPHGNGRGPDGCPPGHGGQPPSRRGEGGRGPSGAGGPPGQSGGGPPGRALGRAG
jgi:RNA polymerase sigma factor (sigma-70 family)